MKRVLLTGGGTGGHVFPAVAIGQAVRAQFPHAQIAWAGKADALEARACAKEQWKFFALPAAPLKRMGLSKKIAAVCTLFTAFRQARRIIREFAPDVVIGTGGYVSAAMMLAAVSARVPTIVEEQNSVPGLTNRWLGKFVKRVCVTFPASANYFPASRVVQTGLPVRQHIVDRLRHMERNDGPPWVLLIMGGSQGARRINELVMEMLPLLRASGVALHCIHQTGAHADDIAIARAYAAAGVSAEVHPFIEQMESVYVRAHLAISRSGASSLSELALAGVPAIVVPFPFAADDHQTKNAEFYVRAGAMRMLAERDATSAKLAEYVLPLLRQPEALRAMREQLRGCARPDAARAVVEVAMRVTDEHATHASAA